MNAKARLEDSINERRKQYFLKPRNSRTIEHGGVPISIPLKSAKAKYNGSHNRTIEQALLRPWLFVFVPKRKDGKLCKSKTKIAIAQPDGSKKELVHPAFDKETSFWKFNPVLKKAGYKECQFEKPAAFSIRKHFELIYK